MSGLRSAKQSLELELQNAMQGAAFYQARVALLQEAIEKLDELADVNEAGAEETARTSRRKTSGMAGRGRRAATANNGAVAGKQTKKQSRQRDRDLPSTAGDFWINLISDQPRTAPEVLQAAISQLGIAPSAVQKKKLNQRMVNALNMLVKSKTIQDSGARRERRYFKA